MIVKAIYVHSKFMIIDDRILCIGSANIDNVSFYKSSELNVNVFHEQVCRESRKRLVEEHLLESSLDHSDFDAVFAAFERAASINCRSLKSSGLLNGRVFPLMPLDNYHLICNVVSYPSPIAKMMFKLDLNPQKWVTRVINSLEQSLLPATTSATTNNNHNSFFIQSKL